MIYKVPWLTILALAYFSPMAFSQVDFGTNLFPLQEEHTHGSTVVTLPNGDILVAWFQGSGERWADDVRIMGARLVAGQKQWSEPFLMADVPDFPDVNPVLFLDQRQELWLVWYTVLANQWETSIIKYKLSKDYDKAGPPVWHWQQDLHVRPGGSTERGIQPDDRFVKAVEEEYDKIGKDLHAMGASMEELERWFRFRNQIVGKVKGENLTANGRYTNAAGEVVTTELGYPISRRIGWQTKNKPTLLGDRILLPLYSDGLEMSIYAITDDFGAHWHFSDPIVGIANIQASILQKADGTLLAFMRDNGPPPYRHVLSHSHDRGENWSSVYDSNLPNPGSGSDAVTLPNGHWVMAYNNTENGRHSLAVSLSTDEGQSWPHTRHIWYDGLRKSQAAYPAIIANERGVLNLTYSLSQSGDRQAKTIRHFSFDENWIKEGDTVPGVLRVGASLRMVTPDPLLPVSGGVGIPNAVTEKQGDLFARAMVFEQAETAVAIAVIDNLGWPKVLGDRVRELIPNIPPENILIGATHTHSAPDAYGFADESGNTLADFEYLDFCVKALADAINEAYRNRIQAHLRIAEGEAEGKIAFNYYAEQLYDPRCNVLQAVNANDHSQILGTMINYASHPEVIGDNRGILSPDFCGPLYDLVEKQTGGVALFVNGALGGMVTADNRGMGDTPDASDYAECRRIGELLGTEALRLVEQAEVQRRPLLRCMARQVTFPVTNPLMQQIIKMTQLPYEIQSNALTTTINLVNIGSAQMLTIPGEALPNIGYFLKRKMKGSQNFLLGLTNDAFGYIMTPEDYKSFKRYEYISRVSLGEQTGDILIKESLDMMRHALVPR